MDELEATHILLNSFMKTYSNIVKRSLVNTPNLAAPGLGAQANCTSRMLKTSATPPGCRLLDTYSITGFQWFSENQHVLRCSHLLLHLHLGGCSQTFTQNYIVVLENVLRQEAASRQPTIYSSEIPNSFDGTLISLCRGLAMLHAVSTCAPK